MVGNSYNLYNVCDYIDFKIPYNLKYFIPVKNKIKYKTTFILLNTQIVNSIIFYKIRSKLNI